MRKRRTLFSRCWRGKEPEGCTFSVLFCEQISFYRRLNGLKCQEIGSEKDLICSTDCKPDATGVKPETENYFGTYIHNTNVIQTRWLWLFTSVQLRLNVDRRHSQDLIYISCNLSTRFKTFRSFFRLVTIINANKRQKGQPSSSNHIFLHKLLLMSYNTKNLQYHCSHYHETPERNHTKHISLRSAVHSAHTSGHWITTVHPRMTFCFK